MNNKHIQYCLQFFLFLFLYSCASSLPPNSFIANQYFSITSPNEEAWNVIEENESKTSGIILLQKGHGPGNLSAADYPIKSILIIRRKIPDSLVIERSMQVGLNEIVRKEVDKTLSSFDSRNKPCIDQIVYESNDAQGKQYYNFTYTVYFPYDSSDPSTPPIPNHDKGKITLGRGIGQYFTYLPKFYKEWNSYYLFIYDEYPEVKQDKNKLLPDESVGRINNSRDIKTDNVILMPGELSELTIAFKCIEDSVGN